MSLRSCMTRGCPQKVRTGLLRSGDGGDGQPLADGRYCWRCRAKQATTQTRKRAKERSKKKHEKWMAEIARRK